MTPRPPLFPYLSRGVWAALAVLLLMGGLCLAPAFSADTPIIVVNTTTGRQQQAQAADNAYTAGGLKCGNALTCGTVVTAVGGVSITGAGVAAITAVNFTVSRIGHTTASNGFAFVNSAGSDNAIMGQQGSSTGVLNWNIADTTYLYAPNRFRVATGVIANNYFEVTGPAVALGSGTTLTVNNTTDATAVGAASSVLLGGQGVAKRSFLGTIGSTFQGNVEAGVQNGTADTAGAVGEVTQGTNQTTYANYTTTATLQQVAVLTNLTPGRWRIVGTGTYFGNGATEAAAGESQWAISTTTASIAGAVEGRSIGYVSQGATANTQHATLTIDTDVNISAATSYFLNSKAPFTVGNPQFVGSLTAYRLR